jgi:putative ATP-dependent endonuclease of the OLD family
MTTCLPPARRTRWSPPCKYEAERPEQCELIPSEDQFYGFSRGTNRLAKYIQWGYVPAVKDVTKEQVETRDTALGKLLARTVRSKINFSDSITELSNKTREQYQKVLDGSQDALNEISRSLRAKLTEWAHPNAFLQLQWSQDTDKSVRVEEPFARIIAGEGDFQGELARFGHGLQRSYLLALLQELSGTDDPTGPRLVFGCEEPELYQHPPQARHLAAVLQKLSRGNSQVIVSTPPSGICFGRGIRERPDGSTRRRPKALEHLLHVLCGCRETGCRRDRRAAKEARGRAGEDSSSAATLT